MKASLFILLIAVGLCSARPKFGFGHPTLWYGAGRFEDELMNNEATDEDEGVDEPAEEATEGAEEEATEEAEEEATEEAEEKEEATEEAEEEATEEAEEEATEEAEEEEEATEEAEEEAVEAEVTQQATGVSATWSFLGNWEEEVNGDVTAGGAVEIVYDGSRLPGRYNMYGQPAWSISVQYKFSEDGEVHTEKLDGPEMIEGVETLTKSIFVPFGTTTLTVWFKHWGYYSSYSYDSNYGNNYHAEVSKLAETTIVFDSGSWAETVHGDLEKGGKFNVYYDFKRLDDDEDVHAVAKFFDDSTYTRELQGPIAGSHYVVTTYTIPQEAENVILWFYIGHDDERKYDSNYGNNYVFPLKEESESQNEAVGA